MGQLDMQARRCRCCRQSGRQAGRQAGRRVCVAGRNIQGAFSLMHSSMLLWTVRGWSKVRIEGLLLGC